MNRSELLASACVVCFFLPYSCVLLVATYEPATHILQELESLTQQLKRSVTAVELAKQSTSWQELSREIEQLSLKIQVKYFLQHFQSSSLVLFLLKSTVVPVTFKTMN